MQYKCPQCDLVMEAIFCDCQIVAGIHVFIHADGHSYHSRCGKRVPDKVAQSIKEWYEKENDKKATHS